MPRALLFLLLLLLGAVPMALGAGTGPAALLAELAQHNPPQALPGRGFRCRDLRPAALPGFPALPPRPRALVRAAMALALSVAACSPQAEAEVRGLMRELGPSAAAALLRGLARLRRDPAPEAVSLVLLSLVRPCAAGTPPTADPASESIPVPQCHGAVRRQRDADDACAPPGEQEAHGVLEWVPGVSTFYNLGTSIYYAFQGCEVMASTRALEVAEDLGYASLAAIAAAAGGPVALGVQVGLQPGLRAGVRALITYFTSDGEPPTAPSAHSGPVLIV
ncbi:apolipoprotein F [Strigops habroptila]|uniref:apolipoprotein F n=1 Tax=Strigops habroptila TaxID=2489341 RepID=UPI0011CF489C|nr:apolipoprotein F [Strigops habroptila]